MKRARNAALVALACCGAAALLAASVRADDSAGLKTLFANPPRQYSPSPLWVWNDMLTDDEIKGTLADLAGQQVKQAFVHPRPGLMTPYLTDEWFRLWKVALAEAERLDMNLWIYDEDSYPSGFAGGLVPEAMPESRGYGLAVKKTNRVGPLEDDVLCVVAAGNEYRDVTQDARAGKDLPEGSYLVVSVQPGPAQAFTAGGPYVDLLRPGVTEKFIEITMEAYRRQIGEHFGGRVPGWFTDEPNLRAGGGIYWSDFLPELFEKRWGYDLKEHLAGLVAPVGDFKRVRHDYYQLLLEQFIKHWGEPCFDYCAEHNLEFTGHYWEHGWPNASHGPDNMAMYAWQQRPGIDILMNEYSETVGAQFGNARSVRELASVANQLGRKRTLCEAYGAGGWDLRFEDMKRIGDWIYVLGVNTMDEHLSYVTIRGTRKRDHPQSFSYHEPWWEAYHVMAGYFTRLSAALSHGRQINRILVIEPTTTAWMYQPDGASAKELGAFGQTFQDLVNALERAQIEYDLGCEEIIDRFGSVDGAELVVGQRAYHTVVLPPTVENLNRKTLDLITAYAKAGGRVISCCPPPTRCEGVESPDGAVLAQCSGWKRVEAADVPGTLAALDGDGFSIRRQDGDQGILFHNRRHLDDGQLLFLVNTSIDSPSTGVVKSPLAGAERWDLHTGGVSGYPVTKTGSGIEFRYDLPPCGSLLLFLSNKPRESGGPTAVAGTIAPSGPPAIRRLEPNVLTIDYLDVAAGPDESAGGESRKNVYCRDAGYFAFQQNGMPRNPWDHAVQFRDTVIRHEFAPKSFVEATYRFTIEDRVPKRLWFVVERPDLYTITVNGKPVKTPEGSWWLDRAFGRFDVASLAKVGENAVTIHASPFTVFHEIEAAYLLGDFSLKAAERGFVVVPPKPLDLGPWNEQGMPMYAHGVGYSETFEVAKPSGRYFVRLAGWYGSVAKVIVNGEPAGYIGFAPWRCDVTEQIRPGKNTVEVVVVGTLKNTLGPHHAGVVRGRAWPWAFYQAPKEGPPPGEKYDTIGYGLFEPFALEREK